MKLIYKASGKDGKVFEGTVEAKNTQEAAVFLRQKGLFPIDIKTKEGKTLLQIFPFLQKKSDNELLLFTRQMSSMLTSGLTLMQGLLILQEQMQNVAMRDIVRGIIAQVQEGKTLSKAIAKYPQVFSPIYIALVKAGESSGFLEKILQRLADNLEKSQQLKSTIKGALLYPVIVIILMVVVLSLMMIFVIPQLSVLYDNIGIELPLPTKIVVGLSDFMVHFWWLLLALVIGGIVLFQRWRDTKNGRYITDRLILRVPIFGKLISQTILTEFSRTFGLLVSSGTLIVKSLQETAEIAGNVLYKEAILEVASNIERGISIGDAMSPYPKLFPPLLIEMVKVGEQTGKLDESLLKVSEYYEREVEVSVKALTTAMEPIIMVILGLGVAFLIISVITPIYSLTSSL